MRIKVRVKTNASGQSVDKIPSNLYSEKGYEGFYFARLKSSPECGKANLELIKLLTHHFRKPVRIKAGFTSRDKIIEVG